LLPNPLALETVIITSLKTYTIKDTPMSGI
jgi:hypothetical protein